MRSLLLIFLLVFAFAQREEYRCPVQSRSKTLYCANTNDRPHLRCNDCRTPSQCARRAQEGDRCIWDDTHDSWGLFDRSADPVCKYKDTRIRSVVWIFGMCFFVCFGYLGCLEYSKRNVLEEEQQSLEFWAIKYRFVEYNVRVDKREGFWYNLCLWICNELEICKIFFGHYAHYTTRFEAFSVLLVGFSWSAYTTSENQLDFARGVDYSMNQILCMSFLEVTVPATIVSSVFLLLTSLDERILLTTKYSRYGYCLRSLLLIIATIMSLGSLYYIMKAGEKITYVLYPTCTLRFIFEFGFIYPQFLKLIFIVAKTCFKWYIEENEHEENCINSIFIKLSYVFCIYRMNLKLCDDILERIIKHGRDESYIEELRKLGVNIPDNNERLPMQEYGTELLSSEDYAETPIQAFENLAPETPASISSPNYVDISNKNTMSHSKRFPGRCEDPLEYGGSSFPERKREPRSTNRGDSMGYEDEEDPLREKAK